MTNHVETDAAPTEQEKIFFAVFELYPEQPIAWTDERGAYIPMRGVTATPARYVQCERMKDGRLAVLKTKLGSALRHTAERAASEIGGLVIEVRSPTGFTSAAECFSALAKWQLAQEDECQLDTGPIPT